jgi:hypothetical protein
MSKKKVFPSHTFTTTGVSEIIAVKDTEPLSKWTLQVDVDAGITGWTVTLLGSLSGAAGSFKEIIKHKSGFLSIMDDDIVWDNSSKPVNYIQLECSQLDGVGNAIAYWIGQT